MPKKLGLSLILVGALLLAIASPLVPLAFTPAVGNMDLYFESPDAVAPVLIVWEGSFHYLPEGQQADGVGKALSKVYLGEAVLKMRLQLVLMGESFRQDPFTQPGEEYYNEWLPAEGYTLTQEIDYESPTGKPWILEIYELRVWATFDVPAAAISKMWIPDPEEVGAGEPEGYVGKLRYGLSYTIEVPGIIEAEKCQYNFVGTAYIYIVGNVDDYIVPPTPLPDQPPPDDEPPPDDNAVPDNSQDSDDDGGSNHDPSPRQWDTTLAIFSLVLIGFGSFIYWRTGFKKGWF